MVSTLMTEMSSEDAGQWPGSRRLLDLDYHKTRIRAMRIRQLASPASQKAVFLQDFVKSLPFGCVAAFDHVPAAAVLRAGWGDAIRKASACGLFCTKPRPHAICESRKFLTPEPA